jgi:hypothetical protein
MVLILTLLKSCYSSIFTLLDKTSPTFWLITALVTFGWWEHRTVVELQNQIAQTKLEAAKEVAAAEAKNRQIEQEANQNEQTVSTKLAAAQANLVSQRSAALKQLRDVALAYSANNQALADSLATCRGYVAPAVSVLPDSTVQRLVGIASDADAVSNRLVALQGYVTTVIKPALAACNAEFSP